jgi:hypothetical protein
MTVQTFTFSSDLRVSADIILASLNMRGVNAELRPLVRMTAPRDWASRSILECPSGQTLFQSWILLFGILPIDRHTFYLESIDPATGFAENSSSTINAIWRHRRMITPLSTGCRLTDTVEYRSRLPLLGGFFKPAYRLVFFIRHRYLRKKYSGHSSDHKG